MKVVSVSRKSETNLIRKKGAAADASLFSNNVHLFCKMFVNAGGFMLQKQIKAVIPEVIKVRQQSFAFITSCIKLM